MSSIGSESSEPLPTASMGPRTAPIGIIKAILCLSDTIFRRSLFHTIIDVEAKKSVSSRRALVRLMTLIFSIPYVCADIGQKS